MVNASSISTSSRSSQPLQHQSSRTYVVLDNDFDIFPYLIDLFSLRPSRKVVCFVKEIGVVSYLTEQVCTHRRFNLNYMTYNSLKLNEALPVPALVALAQSASKLQQAADEFNSASGALLFWSAYTEPHSSLRTGRIDLVVHLGWTGDPALSKSCSHGHLIP